MEKYIDMFLNFLFCDKKLTKNTIYAYRRDLYLFGDYLDDNDINFLEVSANDVNEYLSYMEDKQEKKQSSMRRTHASLKSFYEYLRKTNEIEINPLVEVVPPKVEKSEPVSLTFKEVTLLLEQPNDDDLKGIRDKALLEFAYATGMKASELTNINIDDINIDEGYVLVKGKYSIRKIPLGQASLSALADYITNARDILVQKDENALFVNINGKRLTRQGYWKIIKYYSEQANIQKDVTPYVLRHSFATHLLQNGAEIEAIQNMLGHKEPSSTQIYKKMQEKSIKNIYDQTFPRA